MIMRRDPLLRMAAVGGVAYMGSKAGASRANAQAQQAQQAQAAPAPAPQPPAPAPNADAAVTSASERIAQLKELAELKDSGALSQEEFEAEKAKILA
jgi:Short C-terminal domain